MELIIDNLQLTNIFENLIKRYKHIQFCVAWAGEPIFKAAKLLCKNKSKIERAVVGLHFYQTHPKFIREFSTCEAIRYRKKTNGVFHDKIYLFYNSTKEWSAIIGSSNFTNGGFEKNNECNILITNEDANDSKVFDSLVKHIETMRLDASLFTEIELLEYEKCFKSQSGKLDSLSRIINNKTLHFINSQEVLNTWEGYCALLNKNPKIKERLSVLSDSNKIFKKYKNRSFGDMTELERRKICGAERAKNDSDLDYGHFGTNANATLLKQMYQGEKHIVKAIDSIPLTGDISEEQYNSYVKLFCKSNWKNPLAGATRLLAMKRPDVFICVNGANIPQLAKSFEFAKSTLSLENYWDRIIVPIHKCSWYRTAEEATIGKKYCKYRVALLDAIYYKSKSE